MTSPPDVEVAAVWGPELCGGCGGPLPRGLVKLGRTSHVNCGEAREAWKALNAKGKAPEIRYSSRG